VTLPEQIDRQPEADAVVSLADQVLNDTQRRELEGEARRIYDRIETLVQNYLKHTRWIQRHVEAWQAHTGLTTDNVWCGDDAPNRPPDADFFASRRDFVQQYLEQHAFDELRHRLANRVMQAYKDRAEIVPRFDSVLRENVTYVVGEHTVRKIPVPGGDIDVVIEPVTDAEVPY